MEDKNSKLPKKDKIHQDGKKIKSIEKDMRRNKRPIVISIKLKLIVILALFALIPLFTVSAISFSVSKKSII